MTNEKKIPETINDVYITGTLVKKDIKYTQANRTDENGLQDAISATLLLRSDDGSEHEVNYFAYKLTKDGNESKLFTGIEEINRLASLEDSPENADIIKIGNGSFDINDYVSQKDGTLKSYNKTTAKFINVVDGSDLEINPLKAEFEVQGVISKIEDEIYKNEHTGNKLIRLDMFGYNGKLIPIKLTIMEDMVKPFMGAGFFEGGFAKFAGKILNTKTTETITEKQTFGEDIVKHVTHTVRMYKITGGSKQGTIYDNQLTDELYDLAKSKRRLKLTEIQNKANGTGTNQTQNTQTTQQSNPFSNNNDNPFA